MPIEILFILLIYWGGLLADDDVGFWEAVVWPYHLGKKLYFWSKERKERRNVKR